MMGGMVQQTFGFVLVVALVVPMGIWAYIDEKERKKNKRG